MNKRNTLICTVGTSLFESNLKNLSEKTPNAPENWAAIRRAYDLKNWKKLTEEMLKVDPTQRVCGAEINTIEETKRKNCLDLQNLIFLVSDTESGRNTGEFLKLYFESREDLDLKNVLIDVVPDLQDERPVDFKVHGLRNLVRRIGHYLERFGGADHVAIDATGGYKAQIAIAVIVGQALNMPVFYKHEKFSEIIDFPPLPISFDHEILANNAALLTDFERGEVYSSDDLGEIDEKLRVLLAEVNVDGKPLYELSPIGQIYLTGFRLRYPKPINLKPAEQKPSPSFPEHHYPNGYREFVQKVCNEMDWIVTANSVPYDKQKSIKGIGFYVRKTGEKSELIGTYQDKNNFGARFRLHLTDESLLALAWAADFLNQKYRENPER